MKYFVLHNAMIEQVLRLLHRPERWLVVAAIRFVRACLAPKDEFYNRHIVSYPASGHCFLQTVKKTGQTASLMKCGHHESKKCMLIAIAISNANFDK